MRVMTVGLCLALFSSVASATAGPSEKREALECFPAEGLVALFSKFSKFDTLKPEQRDTVDAEIIAVFSVKAGDMPERLFHRHGAQETDFTIAPDGTVSDFARMGGMSPEGELCISDPTRAGMDREEDDVDFDVDFGVIFLKADGEHSLAELKDGAKDGKSFYKKLVPAPVRLMLPKMTHVSLSYDADNTPLDIMAVKGGQAVPGLTAEPFGDTWVISLKALEALGADGLRIGGGAYVLEPSPSIKKMKQLGFGEDEENDAEE